MPRQIEVNLAALQAAMQHLEARIRQRVKQHYGAEETATEELTIPSNTVVYFIEALDLETTPSILEGTAFKDEACYYAILLALVPHLDPHFFDTVIQSVFQNPVDFPQIGGMRGQRRVFIPTLETLFFIAADNSLERRLEIQRHFEAHRPFAKNAILYLEETKPTEPLSNSKLVLSKTYVELLTIGQQLPPKLSTTFPAKRLKTQLPLEKVILNPSTRTQVNEIEYWMKYGRELLADKNLGKHIKRGYRALFYGSPGTGKTLTAAALGTIEDTERPVYAVDLSMVVSKYIGETEKNLSNLFDAAEHQDWILFFDEADALFGKRTNVKDSHDRYSNQELAFLLQRIENYDGLVIMATNMKQNIDEAFLRRFQSIVHFPMPDYEQRLQIWHQAKPSSISLGNVKLDELAKRYKLSGASIVNVLYYCSLQAKNRAIGEAQAVMKLEDFQTAIRREYGKDGRVMS